MRIREIRLIRCLKKEGSEVRIFNIFKYIIMKKINLLLLMLLMMFGYGQLWAQDLLLVGDESQQTTYSNRLIGATATQSYSETIYKKADLTSAGLEEGTGIKRIVYKGTYTGSEGTIPVMVWIGNTTDEAPATTQYVAGSTTEYNYDMADPDELGMTLIFDGDYTVTAPGDDGIVMEFAVPSSFRYAGNNLRIMVVKPESEATLSRGLNVYSGMSSYTDFKNTMFRQNTGIFSLVTSPFLWIETGVASDHNFKITENTLPTQATVNVPYEATITVLNQGIAEAAGGYTVKYYFDDEEVATTEAVALAKDATATFTFTYTPTALGRHTSYAEIVFPDGASVKTSKVNMKVEEADPRWSWDFEEQTWPEGCYFSEFKLDSWVHLSANGYYLCPTDYSPGTNPVFITPLLHAQAGEAFYFDAAKYGESFFGVTLNVMVSKDRKTWTTVKTIEESDYTGAQVGGSSSQVYDFSNFDFTIAEEGDYYIMFNGGARIDNLYGFKLVEQAHDIWSREETLPTEGMANNEVTANWTVMNLMNATETATAAYYINGVKVGEAAQQSLTTRSEKTFTVSCMPHETGTFNSYMELTLADGTTLRSSEVEITIAEEEPKGETLIGDYYSYSGSIPVQTTSTSSFSDMIWTAADLQSYGIVEGTTIKGIVFKGYSSSEVTAPVQVWMGTTTATTPVVGSDPTADLSNTEGMTKVFDGDYTFQKGGSYGAANMIDIMTITLAEPFVYDGTNLHIHAQCVQDATQTGVQFGQSNLSGAAYKAKSQWSDSYYGNDNTKLPWIALLYDKEASHFTGTLTIKNADQSITPIAGTTLTLTSDDGVSYSGTTDADGKFDFAVMQDTKTYTLTFDYTEKNIFPLSEEDQNVTFEGTSVEKDIQLTEGVDFFIEAFDTPATGTTNTQYTATVTAKNYNQTALAADAYTATLYVNGKAVAQAETVEVAPMASQTFTFTFTPHEAGTFANSYIELAGPTATVKTDAYELTVAAETAGGDITVLDNKSMNNEVPLNFYYKHSLSETVYTKEKLAEYGVNAGAQILKMALLSYKPSGTTNVHVQMWLENTEDDGSSAKSKPYTDGMTKIYDQELTLEAHGTSSAPVEFFKADLSENPFVYTGENLRLIVLSDADAYESSAYRTQFATDNTYNKTWTNKNDNTTSTDLTLSGGKASPVLSLTLPSSTHFTGKVTDKSNQPIEGAKVTLTNAASDVVYYAVTDAEGAYDVEVVQNDKDYAVTVEAEGYTTLEVEGSVNVSEGDSADNNYQLSSDVLLGDADGNGEVNNADAVAVLRHLVDNTPSNFVPENADVNQDGTIDNADAVLILRMLVE